MEYITQRWTHYLVLSARYTLEPQWREQAERIMREDIKSKTHALSIELEELIDEREQPDFKPWIYGSDLFKFYVIFKLTMPADTPLIPHNHEATTT